MTTPHCPICDGIEFVEFRKKPNAQCSGCGSLARHRAAWLFLRDYIKPQPNWHVLHLAPDRSLANYFTRVCPAGYDPADIDPESYDKKIGRSVRKLDLITDADTLPTEHYDLVLHSHVIEHVPTNVTLLLMNLHRAVKPGGYHLLAFPVGPGFYHENLDPKMPEEERLRLFKHKHHFRRIGRKDFDVTVGPVLGLKSTYSLADHFSRETLLGANIPEEVWVCTGSSVFMLRKAGQ
jgi:phosphoglycolate phosphatase